MDKGIGRRELLKSVAAASAGLGLAGLSSCNPLNALDNDTPVIGPIPTRKLGKTGYDVKIFGLGGETTIEKRGEKEKAVEIINKAIDLGVNYIDTSHMYGGGGSEKNIGEVMAERREEVFLAIKTFRRDYDGAMRDFVQSLQRLQTDYVDLYQHHFVRSEEKMEQIRAAAG